MATLVGLWFFVLGATIGSFLNVVAYRLPLGLTIVSQPSRCPYCLKPILFRHNVPILGWLMLRGRCRVCRLPISPRYPLVELMVATLFFGLFFAELSSGGANLPIRQPSRHPGVMWNVLTPQWDLIGIYAYHCFLIGVLVVAALLRIDRQPIPNRLVLFAGIVGLSIAAVWPSVSVVPWAAERPTWLPDDGPWRRLETPLIGWIAGMAAGAIFQYLIRLGWRNGGNQPPRSLGQLLSLVGLFLGWQAVVPTLFLMTLAQMVLGVFLRLVHRPPRSDFWATSTLVGMWLLVCSWRPISGVIWLPGAENQLVHLPWLVAAAALAIFIQTMVVSTERGPASEESVVET